MPASLGDSLKPRWQTGWNWQATTRAWQEGAQAQAGELTHDDKGEAVAKFWQPKAGPDRLR